MKPSEESRPGFCIYVNTICEGPVPVERDENGFPVIYSTLLEAQREIAGDAMERMRQFMEGERDFEDAMTVEEYVLKVEVFPDRDCGRKWESVWQRSLKRSLKRW